MKKIICLLAMAFLWVPAPADNHYINGGTFDGAHNSVVGPIEVGCYYGNLSFPSGCVIALDSQGSSTIDTTPQGAFTVTGFPRLDLKDQLAMVFTGGAILVSGAGNMPFQQIG